MVVSYHQVNSLNRWSGDKNRSCTYRETGKVRAGQNAAC